MPEIPLVMDQILIRNIESGAPIAVDRMGRQLGVLSISHRSGGAFCAFTPEHATQLGADLEIIEPKNKDFFGDYLTEAEMRVVDALPPEKRDLAILLAWSGKEAVFKAIGTGLRIDTRNVEIDLKPLLFEEKSAGWQPLQISWLKGQSTFNGCWMMKGDFILTLAYSGGAKARFLDASYSTGAGEYFSNQVEKRIP